jgi:glycosyltransferase involved in cell wall biosynthesis
MGLIKELINQKYDVTVVAPYDKHVEDIKTLGCKYINIDIDNKGSNPLKDFNLILKLKQIYMKVNPDLIIHYTIKPNIYGTIASRLTKTKSIAVVTGLGYIFINNTMVSRIAKLLYKFSFQFSEKVFFINEDDKSEFIINNLVDQNKVVVIPGEGINTNFFRSENNKKNNNEFKFLLIARILWDKGVGEYVEAAKILKTKYKDVEFGLLGYLDVANPKAITKVQMKEWENQGNIKFFGSTDDVKSFIEKSDCIVLPSYREGISMTLMEASSMSKPIIATNVPGCKDLIENGMNGYLCEVRNAQDLADKMEMMLNLSEEERSKMGKKGREKMIKEFDEKIVIDKYLQAIKELL